MKSKIVKSGLSIFFMCTFLTNLIFAQPLEISSLRKLATDESKTFRTALGSQAGMRLTRRDFLRGVVAAGVGVAAVGAVGRPISAAEVVYPHGLKLPEDLRTRVADSAQSCVSFVATQKRALEGGNFDGLHKSYAYDPRRADENAKTDASYIERYGRTWAGYDSALGGYVELANKDYAAAKQTVEALVKLGKEEEAKGFKGLWHFSYNTAGDTFIDPRGPMGANLWGLKFILTYILETRDTTHLDWVNKKIQEFVFGQQVMNPGDARYGLFRFGLYNATDLAKGDAMGYTVYEGDVNAQSEEVAIEHNADAVDMLRLAGYVNIKLKPENQAFINELTRRHDIVMQALNKLWVDDHFVTGMNGDGIVNKSVAVDNNTWVASVLLAYDTNMEKVWQCVDYVRKKITIEVSIDQCENLPQGAVEKYKGFYGERKLKGLFFFTKDFTDSVVPPLGAVAEEMLQPEATYGYVHLLMQFARRAEQYETKQSDLKTRQEWAKRRAEALQLANELVESMVILQGIYGGRLPYATARIPNYFNTLEGMAPIATAAVVLKEIKDGQLNPSFIGVVPHESFVINREKIPPPAPAPDEEDMKPATVKASKINVDVKSLSEFEVSFTVEGAPKGAVAAVYAKTDVWYIQPIVDRTYEIKSGKVITVHNSRGTFGEKRTLILILKDKDAFEEMKKKIMEGSQLRDWEISEKIKEFILRAVIVEEDKTLKELSQAELIEKVKMALVMNKDNAGRPQAQLAVDLGDLDRKDKILATVKTQIGMGFNIGPSVAQPIARRIQKQPEATLIGYLGEGLMPRELIGNVRDISLVSIHLATPEPVSTLSGIGIMTSLVSTAEQFI